MAEAQDLLTELEGAILSEIEHRGQQTAFQVRRAFQLSPSSEWSGSAGSVYPAVKRLVARGLIDAKASGDARATKKLALTPVGRDALHHWATAPSRAKNVGIDPFRLRSGIWLGLQRQERLRLFETLRKALLADIDALQAEAARADDVEAPRLLLNIRLQKDRLRWLEEHSS